GAAGLAAFRTLERRETVATPGAAAAGSAGGMQVDGPLESPTDPPKPSRREFLTWAGGLTGGAVAAATAGTVLRNRIGAAAAPAPSATPSTPPATTNGGFAIDGLSPLITPNDEFYRIDTAFVPPRVDADSHVVRISGMVDQPFEISYAELLDRADVEADVHLACVSNEIGGDLVGNARWTGVPLTELLDEAGVQAPVNQVVGRAVDGWTGGFPLDVVYDGRPALVAVLMNGEPLPVAHGFPVRLVISGLYGYVSDTKWLEEIELTTFDAYDAYWITRGWAREGPVKTHSRIDVPRGGTQLTAGARVIAGVAWAGERGVDGVEVSIDGEPWRAATRGEELARTSWRQWRIDWNAEPGTHILRVRATDGDGEVQTSETARPFPDGASGYHTVTVTVA
ncbi:MAG: molybdopterin-dependent oxidoreductase, partial [Nitriliruptoraceae bacterium]